MNGETRLQRRAALRPNGQKPKTDPVAFCPRMAPGTSLSLALAALMPGFAAGCATADRHAVDSPTQADRLIRVYPELNSGRFAVIADFEDARHIDLFQLIGVSDTAKAVLDR